MPTFETPEPITLTLDLVMGDVWITADDRADTVVEVRPSDPTNASDRKAAEQTRVEYADGSLVVKTAKPGLLDFTSKSWSVDVVVEVPAGSRVHGDTAVGDTRTVGRLAECSVKTSTGHVQLDQVGSARVKTAAGNVTVQRVEGDADVTTGSGRLHIGRIDGAATLNNSNGASDIGSVGGRLRIRAANGDIAIAQAGADVEAKTANGSIRVGEVVRGTVAIETAFGDLDIGIRPGTAAWLDVKTRYGRLDNRLDDPLNDAAPASAPAEETVEVRGRTAYGDITIHRSELLEGTSS